MNPPGDKAVSRNQGEFREDSLMRSNSKNIMLSASASRSDEDQHLGNPKIPGIIHHPQQPIDLNHQASYIYSNVVGIPGVHMNPHVMHDSSEMHYPSIFQPNTRGTMPNLADLYCQIQEMDSRLRHLEMFVFANPGLVPRQANIMDPTSVIPDEMVYGTSGSTSRTANDVTEKIVLVN